jgi:glycosyltransferase involved in cell wall biosynthesis
MKIAIVDQPFGNIILPWTGVGGSVDIITYEIARRLARSFDVTVYTRRNRYQKKVEFDQGVKYQRISTVFDDWYPFLESALDKLERFHGKKAISYNIKRVLLFRNFKRPFFASNLYYFTYALQVAKDLKKKKCDVVHVHNFSQFVPIIRAFNPKIKIVLHMHCEWLTQLDRVMLESRLREVDLIIGVSEYITEKIRQRFPLFGKRCQTLYNGVDVTAFVNENSHVAPKKSDTKQILFVGRVSPEKGVHVLLEAFQKVLKQYPQVQLMIVGGQYPLHIEGLVALSEDPKEKDLKRFYSGNYISYLKNQLSSSEAGHVSFIGAVPHRLLTKLYKDADVCVVPSVCNEPGAMPVAEAMASGVPVVATKAGGIPEVVRDGKTGLLVERGDASALAEAILRLLQDEKLRKSIAKASRERAVEFFSWNQAVKKLLHLYKTV